MTPLLHRVPPFGYCPVCIVVCPFALCFSACCADFIFQYRGQALHSIAVQCAKIIKISQTQAFLPTALPHCKPKLFHLIFHKFFMPQKSDCLQKYYNFVSDYDTNSTQHKATLRNAPATVIRKVLRLRNLFQKSIRLKLILDWLFLCLSHKKTRLYFQAL